MPKLLGETTVYAREAGFTEQYAYVAAGNGVGQVEYQAWGAAGTATSAAGWRIRKFTYNSTSGITKIEWAGGTDKFDQIWDDRTSLSYS